ATTCPCEHQGRRKADEEDPSLPPLLRCRRGIPVEGTLESVLRVAGDPTATITGAQGSQVQLLRGLGAPREKTTSLPTAAPSYRETRPFHPPGSAQRPVDNCSRTAVRERLFPVSR